MKDGELEPFSNLSRRPSVKLTSVPVNKPLAELPSLSVQSNKALPLLPSALMYYVLVAALLAFSHAQAAGSAHSSMSVHTLVASSTFSQV